MNTLFKAPLIWFLLFGFSLFLLDRWHQRSQDETIVITAGDIQRIRDQWQSQSGRPVSEEMLQSLISEQIQERRLYREALALGLDQGDVIIRRRLAQKLRFLTEDLAETIQVPAPDALEAYFDSHSSDYQNPARLTFQQVFFSAENAENSVSREAVAAEKGPKGQRDGLNARAVQALQLLQKGQADAADWQQMGDPFMLGNRFSESTPQSLTQQFGKDFTDQLTQALNTHETHRWFGPIHSVYGEHLIRVQTYQPPQAVELTEVRDRVIDDYRLYSRKQAFVQYLAHLAEKYPAVIATPDATSATQQADEPRSENLARRTP